MPTDDEIRQQVIRLLKRYDGDVSGYIEKE